jgi:uncharacterized protein (UPF0261 family)
MQESLIVLSTCALTQPCVSEVIRLLDGRGCATRIYDADGTGGRALEAEIRSGETAAVLDLSLAELAAELTGSPGGAGPDRLTAAAIRGVPQVIALGTLDCIREQPSPGTRPTATFAGVRYARTTPEENDQLGRDIAHKASAARGPTVVLVPWRGLSALDVHGGPFWWPEADAALVQSLKNWISPHVRVRELDLHVNDPAFAAAAVAALDDIIR